MPFITATREDGATLLVNVDRIQYVAYQDAAGSEVLSVVFDTNPPAQGRPGSTKSSSTAARRGGCGRP